MTDPLDAFRSLASTQYGVVDRAQARDLGIDRRRLDTRVASGECESLTPDVLRFTAVQHSAGQVAMAATLAAGPGSALAGTTALAWWGIPGFVIEPTMVVTPRRTRRQTLGPVKVTSLWPAHHRRVHLGVPTSSPERAMVDAASRLHPKRLERALDTAWVKGLVSGPMMQVVLDELSGTDRPDQSVLRGLLAERGPGWVPPASYLEARFHDLIASAGDEPFQRRVILADSAGIIGEIDCYDPAAGLVVEVDSVRFHASPIDTAHDAARDARLDGIGMRVERVGEEELLRSPSRVLARIRRVRRERSSANRAA